MGTKGRLARLSFCLAACVGMVGCAGRIGLLTGNPEDHVRLAGGVEATVGPDLARSEHTRPEPSSSGAETTPSAFPDHLEPATAFSRRVWPTSDGFGMETPRERATLTREGVEIARRPTGGPSGSFVWRYELAALQAGETRMPLARVAPVANGNVVEYVRPGLVERYVAHDEGIEQVFVLGQSASPWVDLELVGRVTTNLSARLRRGTAEYGEGHGGLPDIRYGAASAFDAAGRSIPVRTELAGEELRLRLDADDLAHAVFPVTIDPIIQAGANTYGAADSENPDVAYNQKRGEFLAVWMSHPVGSSEIRVKRFTEDGNAVGNSAVIGDGNWPSVAYNTATDEYLVVWLHQTWEGGNLATSQVIGQRLSSTGAEVGAEITLSDTYDKNIGPRVAAANFGSGTTAFLVVWSSITPDGSEIWRERVSSTGTELGESQVSDGSGDRPAVAFDPFTNRYLVVWRDSGAIRSKSISSTGAADGAQTDVADFGLPTAPDVAFDLGSKRYLVVWSMSWGGTSGNILGWLMTSADSPSIVGPSIGIHSNPGSSPCDAPAVSAERGGFIVLFERVENEGDPSNDDTDLRAAYVTGGGSCSSDGLGAVFTDSGAGPVANDDWPRMATSNGYGFTFAVWQHNVEEFRTHIYKSYLFGRFAHFVHGTSGQIDEGNSTADLWVFRPSNHTWYVRADGALSESVFWGQAGDVPVLFDVDDDGQADYGVWRPSTGTWYVRDEDGAGVNVQMQWGAAGDTPVPGDYVGDGRDDWAVWRPSTGTWFIKENGGAGSVTTSAWGQLGDVPVPADYDGDGKTELGVSRPSTGDWHTAEVDRTGTHTVRWGTAGDIPLQGNFVGDAHADYVVFRPGNGTWYRRDGSSGTTDDRIWGTAGDIPMPLDYDADGQLDLVVWRMTNGRWYILDDDLGSSASVAWGTAGDIPAGGR